MQVLGSAEVMIAALVAVKAIALAVHSNLFSPVQIKKRWKWAIPVVDLLLLSSQLLVNKICKLLLQVELTERTIFASVELKERSTPFQY